MTVESPAFCIRCGTSIGAGTAFCPRCGTSIPVAVAGAARTVALGAPEPGHAAVLDTLRRATLGEYEILGELGRGGMATVYLAHDLPLDRKVAIKVLAPALLLMGEGMVERFKREARTAAALSHPHIIPIYAVKESEQLLYFVMKYVKGRSLEAVIQDVGPLPIAMVQTILAQVGDALAYAHRHGVIHRDIKSANLMLDEEGWAVITDFGIAKVEEAQGLTMTGVTVGTPAYMSPEQCATCEVTGASDQYSLGVVAYEMLTGRLPFQSNSSMAVMFAHHNEQPRPVTELRPDCPANLAAAVMQMLEKEPEDRWPSMDDVVAVCGRPSLRRDDPIRSAMMTLAKVDSPARRLANIQTPTSPIALAKSKHRSGGSVPRRRGPLWWGLGALGLSVVVWWTEPWRLVQGPPAPSADTVPAGAPAAVAPRPSPPPAPSPLRAGAVAETPPPAARPPAADSVVRSPVVSQEDSVVRSLRATALAAMRRAREAGATSVELASGDSMLQRAETLVAAGRLSEAMVPFVTAATLWNDAERRGRARAIRDTSAAVVRPPVDHRAAIEVVIADYARALESRDVDQVRRAYPGLTASQQQAWHDLFQSVRQLAAGLTVTALTVAGNTAEAAVSGVYEYENATTGRTERRPAAFRVILGLDSGAWRITAIR